MEFAKDMSTTQFIRHRRYLLLSVLAWISCGLIGMFVLFPQVDFLFSIQDTIASQENKLEDLQNKVQFLESFDILQFRDQNAKANNVLPSVKPFLQLLHSLGSLAEEQEVVISGLDWRVGLVSSESGDPVEQTQTTTPTARTPASSSDRLEELTFTVNLLGTAQNINSFLIEINRIAPIVDVTGISLSPRPQLSADLYEASLDVVSYYAPLTSILQARVTTLRSITRLTPEERAFSEDLDAYRDFAETATPIDDSSDLGKNNPFEIEQ